jgi:AcrR family transcriptional regulator
VVGFIAASPINQPSLFLNMFKFDAGVVKLFVGLMKKEKRGGAAPNQGRRERNKADKLRRIKAAARELFIKHGYDDASMREIAHRADVALGTIFSYAADKRDLLFLVANDELAEAAARAAAAVRADSKLLDNLVRSLSLVYEYFGEEPQLSRLTLREMQFYEVGAQAKKFLTTRDRMRSLIVKSISIAIDKGEIATAQTAEVVGGVIFSIFQIEVRQWLAATRRVDVRDGIKQLKKSLSVVFSGLHA